MDCGPLATILFSDLDGCLLNKADYDYTPAVPVLQRTAELGIPIVLASSKTAAEMVTIADELGIPTAPLICENGGIILWRDGDERKEVTGVSRDEILTVLDGLKSSFAFRSFRDLGVDGISTATSLPAASAARAADRHSTEPLLWDDTPQQREVFAGELHRAGLTFTRGGRFYHVAGTATKGAALERVAEAYAATDKPQVIAVGDSPIDQSMLDVADFAVCIPSPDGTLYVQADEVRARVAQQPGSAGWAAVISDILDEVQARREI